MLKYPRILFISLLVIGPVVYMCGCKNKMGKKLAIPSLFSNISVYAIDGFEPEKIDSKILSNTPHVYFDEKLTKEIFGNITYHSSSKVVWKGCYLGIAKLENGEEIKLRININGAFYDIAGHKGYYQTTEKSREIFRGKMKEVILKASESKKNNP